MKKNLEPYKILGLSDSTLGCTGFGTVAKSLFTRLATKPEYDVSLIGWNYQGQPIIPPVSLEDGTKIPYKIWPGGREQYAKDLIPKYLKTIQPDIFWTLLDTFMVNPLGNPWFNNMDFAPAKTVFYFPSDGRQMPMTCENVLRKVDMPVAMSKYARDQVADDHNIYSEYIPHGVNTSTHYYPLSPEQKEQCKAKFGLQGKFVIGSVFRNQGRKMADRMLEAFVHFAKNKPDVILFLHSDPFDIAAPNHLPALINKYGIQHKVRWSGMNFFWGFPHDEMRNVYNAMDIHTLSTSGEGFGIPTIEAGACGIPSAITDYTTTEELLTLKNGKECGIKVPLMGGQQAYGTKVATQGELLGTWNVYRGIVDIQKLAEAYETYYRDRNLLQEHGKLSREKAVEEYDWDKKVFPRWDKLMRSML